MPRKLSRIVETALLLPALLFPQLALAHAVLLDSTPKAHEIVHGSSLQIDLKFNSRVDGARSTLQLAMEDGSVRTLDLATQTSPNQVTTHADGLTKGAYTLRWQALASDSHVTRGQIPFQVDR